MCLVENLTWFMRRKEELSCDSLQDPGIGTAQPPNAKIGELYQVLLGPGDGTAISHRLPEISADWKQSQSMFSHSPLHFRAQPCGSSLPSVQDSAVEGTCIFTLPPIPSAKSGSSLETTKAHQSSQAKFGGHHTIVQHQKWRHGWTVPWGTVRGDFVNNSCAHVLDVSTSPHKSC